MKTFNLFILFLSTFTVINAQFSTTFSGGQYEEIYEICATDCNTQKDFFAGIQTSAYKTSEKRK